jgi:hypothetical protein
LRLNGSTVSSTDKNHYRYLFNFNVYGVGYEGSTYRKTIILNFAGLRQYSHTSKSKKRWQLLQKLYKHYPSLKITEIHFAFDLPYWYHNLSFSPKKHLSQPRFKSTRYFDIRRKEPNVPVRDKDNIVIYDKCRKCQIARPLTRIELRLSREHLSNLTIGKDCIITSDLLQEKLAKKIERKLVNLHIKKGRRRVDRLIAPCPKERGIQAAMEYIKGDDSLLDHLLSHHTSEMKISSGLFADFAMQCKRVHAFQSMPHRLPKIKSYLNVLSPKEKHMIQSTISNYNKYDPDWYRELLREPTKRYRLVASDIDKALFLYQQGETQKDIASELGVSESQISRLFIKNGYRKLKDSQYYFGDVIVG